jgi:hypothetical protein
MAARSPMMESRKFASPAVKALMSQRSAEFGGLLLGLLGLAILVALATYDPRDPSFNTATTRHVSNLAGPVGATLADMLLQGFGIFGALPGLVSRPIVGWVASGAGWPRCWRPCLCWPPLSPLCRIRMPGLGRSRRDGAVRSARSSSMPNWVPARRCLALSVPRPYGC